MRVVARIISLFIALSLIPTFSHAALPGFMLKRMGTMTGQLIVDDLAHQRPEKFVPSAGAAPFEQLTLGRKLVAAATAQKAGSLGICAVGFAADAQAAIVGNVLAAALAAAFRMPAYKRKPDPGKIRSIRLLGLDERLDTARVQAEAKGNAVEIKTENLGGFSVLRDEVVFDASAPHPSELRH